MTDNRVSAASGVVVGRDGGTIVEAVVGFGLAMMAAGVVALAAHAVRWLLTRMTCPHSAVLWPEDVALVFYCVDELGHGGPHRDESGIAWTEDGEVLVGMMNDGS